MEDISILIVFGSVVFCLVIQFLTKLPASPTDKSTNPVPDALIQEQLARNLAFLGTEKMERLKSSLVIVVGCGGVGSHAAHMLARSGIGHLRLIDFDNISLSSLNRAPLARPKDVGVSKVSHLASELCEICPWITIEAIPALFAADCADVLIGEAFQKDYSSVLVLDCIDNISTKVDLLEYCYKKKFPVSIFFSFQILCCSGAGCKWDPTKIDITDISKTTDDRLARSIRTCLRKRGVTRGIPMVYSRERFNGISLMPLNPESKAKPEETAILPEFRARIVPVLGPLPSMFGMAMAMYSLRYLSERSTYPNKPDIFSPKCSSKQIKLFLSFDRKYYGKHSLAAEDISSMASFWGEKSALDSTSNNLCIVKWRKHQSVSLFNIVPLTKNQAESHEAFESPESAVKQGFYSDSWVSDIDRKLDSLKNKQDP